LREGGSDIIYATGTALEVFASDGLCYAPFPVIPKPDALSVEVSATGSPVKFTSLRRDELGSVWK